MTNKGVHQSHIFAFYVFCRGCQTRVMYPVESFGVRLVLFQCWAYVNNIEPTLEQRRSKAGMYYYTISDKVRIYKCRNIKVM